MGELKMMNWEEFMLESNRIEGEDRLNPGDKDAYELSEAGVDTEEDILRLHLVLTKHLNVDWSGRYRDWRIRVQRNSH